MAMEMEEQVKNWLHEQDGKTLLRVQKEITKALEKCVVKERKGKGVVPPQLVCPKAWIQFTLLHAQKNGWEEYEEKETRKDKSTGKMVTKMVTMPCSVMGAEGGYIFEGSVSEKDPLGKFFSPQNAMALSKQRWDKKAQTGTHEELYKEFLEQFEEENQPMEKETPMVVKMTLEEKEAEKMAKKAAEVEKKQREKEAKEEEKKKLKAEAEEKKAAAKEQEKKEKEAAKLAKQMSKVVRADQVEIKLTPPTPSKEKKEKKEEKEVKEKKEKKAKKEEKEEKWVAPEDGSAKSWTYKGKLYYRNKENEVWKKSEDGPEWMGKYIEAEDRIDDEAEEPHSDDEDAEDMETEDAE